MKKIIILVFCIVACILGCLVYNELRVNASIKNKISEKNHLIYQNEQDKEIYDLRKTQLDEIKENNKDKVSKYDEVEAWNQEIIKYLD